MSRHDNRGRMTKAAIALALMLASLAPAGAAEDVRTIEIVAKEFTFQPSQIQVEQGQKIRLKLVNEGRLSHNLHLQGSDVKTQTIQSGDTDTIELTAEETGTVKFHCNVPGHKPAGMKGELVVE